MEAYTLERFGFWLQQVNLDKIVSIRLSRKSEPLFLFFTKIDQLIDQISENYDRPLIKGIFTDTSTTREGTLLLFTEERLEVSLIQSESRRDDYRFFRPEIYGEVKERLMEMALSWFSFVKMAK